MKTAVQECKDEESTVAQSVTSIMLLASLHPTLPQPPSCLVLFPTWGQVKVPRSTTFHAPLPNPFRRMRVRVCECVCMMQTHELKPCLTPPCTRRQRGACPNLLPSISKWQSIFGASRRTPTLQRTPSRKNKMFTAADACRGESGRP